MATTLVKISLLLQYMRFYKTGLMRQVCVGLILIVFVWGLISSVLAWIPCVPVSAYWDPLVPNATCFAFGARDQRTAAISFGTQAGFNFWWDFCVFLAAIPLYTRRDLEKKSYLALTTLFSVGPM